MIMDKHQVDSGRQTNKIEACLYWIPLTILLLLGFSPSKAADHFDPAFLKVLGGSETVDLKVFSQSGGMAPGEYAVTVFINQ